MQKTANWFWASIALSLTERWGVQTVTNPTRGVSVKKAERRRVATKTLLVMKLTAFLMIAALLQVQASSRAQSVSISGKNLTLKKVFSEIKKQTGYVVFGKNDLLENTKPVSLSVRDLPLTELLEIVMKDQPIKYQINSKSIMLSPRTVIAAVPRRPEPGLEEALALPDTNKLRQVNGVVADANGARLVGASVKVKGRNGGTVTNDDGRFTLSDVPENAQLEVSYVGFETNVVRVQGDRTIVVVLQEKKSMLDETVVTAYGKTTKRMATGNIVSISGEDIQRQPVMTVLEALVGRVPGMVISQHSGNSASPMTINIRGRNTINNYVVGDPLYVIDGMPLTYLNATQNTSFLAFSTGAVQGGVTNTNGENPLFSINPADIERIDVLKDADATAIYGSRAANGVILITTKRGKPGPTRIDFSVRYGHRSNQRYPKLLNTPEYLAIRREAMLNDGIEPDVYNAPDLTLWDTTKYTNWQKTLVGTGNNLNLNMGVSGGTPQTTYSVSASFDSERQLMNNGGKNIRGGVTATLNNTSLNQKFRMGIVNAISMSDVESYAIGDLTMTPPNAPDIYNEKGEFNFVPYRGQTASTFPFIGLKTPSFSETFVSRTNVNMSYQVVKGLQMSYTAGYNYSTNDNSNYHPLAARDTFYRVTQLSYYGKTINKGFNVEPQLSYSRKIARGDFSFQVIGAFNYQSTWAETITAQDFPNDALMKSHNNAGTKTTVEGLRQYKYLSGAGILRYAWDKKYILNLNGKRDGSSKFGPGKQFGNFFSVGAAWIASEEKWLSSILPEWISFVKFRGSFGITGSDNLNDYEYLTRWGKGISNLARQFIMPYNGMDAFHVLRPLDQDFQWESTRKSEIAVNLGFFDNRLTLDVSTYRHLAIDQLANIATPQYTGFTSITGNWPAEIANTGLEIDLNARVVDTRDVRLTLGVAFSRNRDKMVDFPNLDNTSYRSSFKIGKPTTVEYLLHYTGINPLTGAYSFEDYNKDGTILASGGRIPLTANDDRYVEVNPALKFDANGRINFSYKDFTLNANFYYKNRLREDPYLNAIVGGMYNIALSDEIYNNRWVNPGDQAKYPRFTTNSSTLLSSQFRSSDAKYVNGAYLRMTALSIGYNLPQSWCKKIGMKDMMVSAQTANLFTISPYKGLDPEINNSLYSTPIPRNVSFNLRFNF